MGYQLINTLYWSYTEDGSDKLIFVLKDENGEKSFKVIEKPALTYYVTKPEYWNGKIVNFIEHDKVQPVKVLYKDLYKSIIQILKDNKLKTFYQEVIASGQNINNKLRKLHLDYRLHGSDMNIQDYYISELLDKYPYENNKYGITKTFFDIEVDSSMIQGFPDQEKAEAPINAITLVDGETAICYSFVLKYDTETYNKVFNDIEGYKKKLEERYDYISKKLGKQIKFKIYEFDVEMDLIKAFFDKINIDIKPDFCLAWNIAFDFVYIYNRILNLGGDPNEIMTVKEFPYKMAKYSLDKRNQDPADKGDAYYVSGYTVYLDLMNLYASLRKANGKKESYALDVIGEEEVGMKKDKIETNIKTYHFDDYEGFLTYNIQDTIMLMMIEDKTKDVDSIYSISIMTRTRIEKALKKTICLRNFASLFYRDKNAYMSNNRSSLYEKNDEKIKGAFVGNPNNIKPVGIELVLGKSNRIMKFVLDFDLASLYPNLTITLNISPESCYGKITVTDSDGNDITDIFIDELTSNNSISFAHKHFNFPDLEGWIYTLLNDEEIKKYL